MADKSEFNQKTEDLLGKIQSLDGIVIRNEMQQSNMRLANDDKGAIVNDIVDKYMRKELTNEYLKQAKIEHKITNKDITREIVKRQIEKVLDI